jgi:pimeloyl-ACP methyl ester carboxylesterase
MSSAATPRSRYVMVNGVKTHYTESGGDGPVLLGMHGGGAGSSGAAGMGKLFELLGDRFRVIGLDSIGGYGDTQPVPLRYGLQSRVDHAAEFADALCLDKFTIMGNSQGAWCAARYAILHPDRIENVVLLSSGSISGALGIKSQPSEGQKLLQGYDGTRPAMQRLLKGLVFNSDKITDALTDLRQAAATRPGAMDVFAASDKSIRAVRTDPILSANYDMRATLPLLTKAIPTAFVWGENDIFAIPEVGRQIEAMLPDSTWHWIANAGHQVQTDQPEKVADIVAAMMNKTAGKMVNA